MNTGFKAVSTKLWIKVLRPVWSFIINLFYWICRINKISEAKDKKKICLILPLDEVMQKFKWKADNYKDWFPWVITIVNRDLEDDCDGAAVLAKWWWKNNNTKSRIVYLYSSDYKLGHAVCITSDNSLCVSNSNLFKLDVNNWRQDLLYKFNNTYSIIFDK